jgi:hypothetical protein
MPIKTSKPLRKKLDGDILKIICNSLHLCRFKQLSDWLLEAIPLKFGFLTIHLPVIGTF